MKPCNENLIKVIDSSRELLKLADQGDNERDDEGCGVLYGVVRDAAYKMLSQASKEVEKHKRRGAWDGEDDPAMPDDARENSALT
jgi:hypothetical protein